MQKTSALGVVAFNRPSVTNKLVAALSDQNIPFFLFLDGPKTSEDINAQKEIIRFCEGRALSIIKSKKNNGLRRNIEAACCHLSNISDTFIILEDDVTISNNFRDCIKHIEYQFHSEHKCASVALTTFPELIDERQNIFQTRIFLPWGFLTTSANWKEYYNKRNIFFEDENFDFNVNDDGVIRFLKKRMHIMDTKFTYRDDVWSIYWHYYWLHNGKYFGLLSKNICSNIGLKLTGVHEQIETGLYAEVSKFALSENFAAIIHDQNFTKLAEDNFTRHWIKSYLSVQEEN